MKTGENITEAMIPEFELSPAMEQQVKTWAALDDLDKGLTPEDVFMLYGVTMAQLEPHQAAWRAQHPRPAHV